MDDPYLGWLKPTNPTAVLARAADILALPPDNVGEPPAMIPAVHNDFWGSVVILYEAGRIVAIEQRELR